MNKLQRFDAKADPDDVVTGLERDGAVVVERLLSPDVVERVNE